MRKSLEVGGGTRMFAATTIVAVLSAGLAAPSATALGDSLPPSLAGWGEARSDALSRLEATRAIASSGEVADGIRAAARLADVPVQAPALPNIATPSDLTASLVEPVGRLIAARAVAAASVRASISPDAPTYLRAVRLIEGLGAEATSVLEELSARKPSAAAMQSVERLKGDSAVLSERVEREIDRSQLYSGALALAAEVDRSVSLLAEFARTLPTHGQLYAGCDVYDQPGVLCIGGTGVNLYDRDYSILIDLGGDDLHTHSAGGANNVTDDEAAVLSLDLGGNDRYVYEEQNPPGLMPEPVQGSAASGIGMLVDVSGNDSYAASTTKNNSDNTFSWIVAQAWSFKGVGVLADLSGVDKYTVTNTSLTREIGMATAQGQAYALYGGLSVVLDAGLDSDSYLVQASPEPFREEGTVHVPKAHARGFANSLFSSTALWSDSGGNDTASLESILPTISADDPRDVITNCKRRGSCFGYEGTAEGLGSGFSAPAVLLSGPGDSTFSIRVLSAARRPAWKLLLWGLGAGLVGGYGGVHDAGGNDTYTAEVRSDAAHIVTAAPECECTGADAEAVAGKPWALAQGFAALGGVGVMRDIEGLDTYRIISAATSRAEARDLRPAVDGLRGRAIAKALMFGGSEAWGQGMAVLGTAFVIDGTAGDLDGEDHYELITIDDARAYASAEDSGGVVEGHAEPSSGLLMGQGMGSLGYGELTDLAGYDYYRAEGRVTALATPNTSTPTYSPLLSVQGAVFDPITPEPFPAGALLRDVDVKGGLTGDQFTSLPEFKACTGDRGYGFWVDCGLGLGIGINT